MASYLIFCYILAFFRSRTSSFGCGQRCYGLRDTNDVIVHPTDAETDYTSALPLRRTYERCREQR